MRLETTNPGLRPRMRRQARGSVKLALVTVAVIAVVVLLLVGAGVQQAREAARRTQCK